MPEFFVWDAARFDLHVPEMDQEHRTLVGYMNELHELYSRNAGRTEQGRVLDKLASFTIKHFQDEETYMTRMAYPRLHQHQLIHAELLRRLEDFAADYRRSGSLSDDFFLFLRTWLKTHICGIDMQYARAVNAA